MTIDQQMRVAAALVVALPAPGQLKRVTLTVSCKTCVMRTPPVPRPDVHEADWYADRLAGFGGRVECVIPTGFPAYARILHPAAAAHGSRVRWAEVAAASGTVLHPTAQFTSIAGLWDRYYHREDGIGWPGQEPEEGNLDVGLLRVLSALLATHTSTPDRCWLTVWEGYGNLPAEWALSAPRVHQPRRAYYLFQRPLRDVVDFSIQMHDLHGPGQAALVAADPTSACQGDRNAGADPAPAEPFHEWSQSPNQWWPADRAWCVATGIDFDSTLVAGSRRLMDEILEHHDLEAFRVLPTTDLTINGDHVNPRPSRP